MAGAFKPRRIILVVGGTPASLVGFRKTLLHRWVDSGAVVHACAAGEDLRVTAELSSMGVVYHGMPLGRTGMNPLADVVYCLSLFRLMRRERVTVVLAYTHKPVVYGMAAAAVAGVQRRVGLVTGLGYAFTDINTRKKRFANLAIRLLYVIASRVASKLIFQNPDDRDVLLHACCAAHVPHGLVAGSGVPLAEFPVRPLPSSPPRFLMIARLLTDKGVREFAAAARLVRKSHPEVAFDLVGSTDSNPASIPQSEVESWIQEGILFYHGQLSDVRPALAACSVFVLPSYREGTPRSTLEALATGRAVITTDAPGCRETVISGENGFLVPVANVDELAGAILRMVKSPELMVRFGARSRALAEQRFDAEKVAQATIALAEGDACCTGLI